MPDITKTVSFSTAGLSVIGIARQILEYMEKEDAQYPSQYSLIVESQNFKITRRYQESK